MEKKSIISERQADRYMQNKKNTMKNNVET